MQSNRDTDGVFIGKACTLGWKTDLICRCYKVDHSWSQLTTLLAIHPQVVEFGWNIAETELEDDYDDDEDGGGDGDPKNAIQCENG